MIRRIILRLRSELHLVFGGYHKTRADALLIEVERLELDVIEASRSEGRALTQVRELQDELIWYRKRLNLHNIVKRS